MILDMTLNGRKVTLAEMFYAAHKKNLWVKLDRYYQQQNVGQWF